MAMLPTFIIFQWLLGLFSVGIIAGGIYSLWDWYQRVWVYNSVLERYVFNPDWGFNGQTALLALGLGLLIWSIAGRLLLQLVIGSTAKGRSGADKPVAVLPAATQRLMRPDGSELHVEFYGSPESPPIILTHGWSLNTSEWNYLKRNLSDRFQLIAWDLPGLGRSTQPKNHDYALENLAGDLEAVLDLAGGRPAILMGHSIGGMIILTFSRLFPKALGTRVKGLILVHTTYTNPVRTAIMAGFFTAIERLVLVPLLHLMIWLFPLVWLMNWMGYFNGTAHVATMLTGFAGKGTWDQIELSTRPQPHDSPAVLARGMLGMLQYDATKTLHKIRIPTLVISGDRDPLCKPQASEFIQDHVPSAQLSPLVPARHMGLIEHHTRFEQLISDFVDSNLPSQKEDAKLRHHAGSAREVVPPPTVESSRV